MYCRKILPIARNLDHLSKTFNYSKVLTVIDRSFCDASEPKIQSLKSKLQDGPTLKDFIANTHNSESEFVPEDLSAQYSPYLKSSDWTVNRRKVFFDVYGCQMNVSDTEIVWSVLRSAGYEKCESEHEADVILLVTCAIRENPEQKIWKRLHYFHSIKRRKKKNKVKIGVLGCMAERLKHQILEKEKAVDVIAGPDSYKDLPRLLASTYSNSQSAVNVLLSLDETYADVMPVRLNEDSISAFVSIMRGCDNMCTYCIVPFTRGRERSRPVESIKEEVKHLVGQGVKEIILLGQNVNSYRDATTESHFFPSETKLASGFKTVYKPKKGGMRFAELLDQVSQIDPEVRIRFTSPHPKDFPDEVLDVIKSCRNICKNLHLPAQSGNNEILERMRRGYTREAYLELIQHVKETIPSVSLSSDFICGFCGETEEQFQDTLTLMETVPYSVAFMFAYSMREKTTAHRRYKDDVPEDVKKERIARMNVVYRKGASSIHKAYEGDIQLVLVEGVSKRSEHDFYGRNDFNTKVIIPSGSIPASHGSSESQPINPGDYVAVLITESNSQVLKGLPLFHSTLTNFDPIQADNFKGSCVAA